MTSGLPENRVFKNRLGEISDRRLIYFAKRSWFSGGSREDIPLKQVVSVRYETDQNIFWGLFLTVIGVLGLFMIIGLFPLLRGIVYLWGSPIVFVVTTGGTANRSVGFPWQKKEAEEFVEALRNQLFKD
jgi:hypothetical protein